MTMIRCSKICWDYYFGST